MPPTLGRSDRHEPCFSWKGKRRGYADEESVNAPGARDIAVTQGCGFVGAGVAQRSGDGASSLSFAWARFAAGCRHEHVGPHRSREAANGTSRSRRVRGRIEKVNMNTLLMPAPMAGSR